LRHGHVSHARAFLRRKRADIAPHNTDIEVGPASIRQGHVIGNPSGARLHTDFP